jgi:hypothetical protein
MLPLLQVAFALDLESDLFFTSDERQAEVAQRESLEMVFVADPTRVARDLKNKTAGPNCPAAFLCSGL